MTLEEQMRTELKAARDIASKYEGDIPDEDLALANQHLKAYQDLKVKWEKGKESDAVKASLAAIGFDLGIEVNEKTGVAPETFKGLSRKSLGALFTEGAEYKGLLAQFNGGNIGEKARVQSQPMGVKHILPPSLKALVTGASDTSGGAFVQTDVQNILEMLGRRPLTVRDLISVRQTESDTVEYVRQTTQMSSAAPVPEATSSAAPTTGASSGAALTLNPGGGYKPEGSIAFEKVTATVKTIAEWVPATKRGLADASQLRGLIDDELRADLAEEEEDQILNGSGSGENLTGILSTSGIQAQAWSTDLFTTIRKAKTKSRTVGRVRANGIVVNPEDAERLDLAKGTSNDHFYGPGPFSQLGISTVWGLPIVESEAIASGVGLVGDFSKAVLWDREQASITATDSHADFFIRNLVAILGEERVAFGVTRPKAFVSVDLTA